SVPPLTVAHPAHGAGTVGQPPPVVAPVPAPHLFWWTLSRFRPLRLTSSATMAASLLPASIDSPTCLEMRLGIPQSCSLQAASVFQCPAHESPIIPHGQ